MARTTVSGLAWCIDPLALDARDETVDWEMTRGSTRRTASHESACGRISLELPFRHSCHLCTAVDGRSAGLTRATTPNPPIRCVARRPRVCAALWFNGGVEDGNRCHCCCRGRTAGNEVRERATEGLHRTRVERLEEEKKAIADDICDVYAEAKGSGFDVKALRAIVRLRKQDTDERREQHAILETYMHALGMD